MAIQNDEDRRKGERYRIMSIIVTGRHKMAFTAYEKGVAWFDNAKFHARFAAGLSKEADFIYASQDQLFTNAFLRQIDGR